MVVETTLSGMASEVGRKIVIRRKIIVRVVVIVRIEIVAVAVVPMVARPRWTVVGVWVAVAGFSEVALGVFRA